MALSEEEVERVREGEVVGEFETVPQGEAEGEPEEEGDSVGLRDWEGEPL